MNQKHREHILTITAIACLALLAGDNFIIKPLTELWQNRAEEIQSLRRSLQKGNLLLTREESLRQRWNEMTQNALPNLVSQAESQVLKAIDRWVDTSSITIISLKPQWREHEEDYKSLECRAVAQGSMKNLVHFLYELEQDPLSLRVEQIEILGRDETGDRLTLTLTFSGIQFIKEEQAT